MFQENKLRKLLNEGKPTLGTRLHSMSPLITETVGCLGKYDYVEFVAEFAPYDQYGMENLVRAAELHQMGSMMKVDFQNRAWAAQKALASGFQAILFTDHTTPEQVEESIKMVTPMCPEKGGHMGFANRRWIGYQQAKGISEYVEMASQPVKAFMVEKKEVVDNIDEFLSVPGIDMVQFGGNDFEMSAGYYIGDHKGEVKAAEKKVIEACLAHGIRPRCEIGNAAAAEYYLDLGVKDFAVGIEMKILQNFLSKEGDAMLEMLAKKGIL